LPFVDVNGVKVYCEVHGKGQTILFLNGVLANTSSWFGQIPYFSKNYQTVLMDFRGQGKSDKPSTRYPMEMHADDVKAVMDHLKIAKAHVVGISFGAEVGLIFATRYPQRLKTLVSACAVSHVDNAVRAMAERWLTAARLRSGRYLFEAVYPDAFSTEFIEKRWDFVSSTAPLYDTAVDIDGFIELMKGFMKLDVTPDLHKIKIPTLVIAAENDKIKSLRYSETIHNKIVGSRLLVIKDAGHTVIWEKPEEFNRAVFHFIGETSTEVIKAKRA
jgi:3-oxoadipate enol-lactonase